MAEGRQRRPPASRPAPEPTPLWRQGYDAVERGVTPRLDSVVRSDGFAQAVGAAAHLQRALQKQAATGSRRMLHAMNLPSASDVTRILTELGRLEKQVRELSRRLDELEVTRDTGRAHTRRARGSGPA
jgi:hypothetical protein